MDETEALKLALVQSEDTVRVLRVTLGKANRIIRELRKIGGIVSVNGWQGEDRLEIRKAKDVWIIKEHRKDKNSGDVKTITYKVKNIHIDTMLFILNSYGTKWIPAIEIYRNLIKHHRLDCELDAFNGGKNRAKHYYPKYYLPIKILESRKLIEYKNRMVRLLPIKRGD